MWWRVAVNLRSPHQLVTQFGEQSLLSSVPRAGRTTYAGCPAPADTRLSKRRLQVRIRGQGALLLPHLVKDNGRVLD